MPYGVCLVSVYNTRSCRYKSAVVLCDMEWVDPDLRVANGIAISDQGDMLRLDAMLMTVQLNLRKLLEVRFPPSFDLQLPDGWCSQ
jgi:hypothetical protein